jgi:hypothetical protein
MVNSPRGRPTAWGVSGMSLSGMAWVRTAGGNDLAYPYWTVEVRFAAVLVSLTGEKVFVTGEKLDVCGDWGG